MQLDSGRYFGESRVTTRVCEASLAVTDYREQKQPWHTHENPTFFVHLRGSHLEELPQSSFEQPMLSIVYHPAEVRHRSSVGPDGMTGLNIELTPEWLAAHSMRAVEMGGGRLVRNPEACCAALRLFDAALAKGSIQSENALVDFVAAVSGEAVDASPPPWLEKAKEYADETSTQPITVREIAEEVGVHPVHLARVFRALTGKSFSSYLQKGRLRHASSLLLQGVSAGNAAVESGFGDQFYMSRCFRREFGFGPRHLKDLTKLLNA